MSVLAALIIIPFVLYLVAGFVACVVVDIEDLKKNRISAIGGLGHVVDFHGLAWFIYLLLWPFWYFAYKKAEKDGTQAVVLSYSLDDQKTESRKEPIQPPETTRGK